MTRGYPSSQEAVAKALAGTRDDLTVAEIARSTGLAQSTVRRAMVELELAGGSRVRLRATGHRPSAGRLPARSAPTRFVEPVSVSAQASWTRSCSSP